MEAITISELFEVTEKRRLELIDIMGNLLEGKPKNRACLDLVAHVKTGNYDPIEIMWFGFMLSRIL